MKWVNFLMAVVAVCAGCSFVSASKYEKYLNASYRESPAQSCLNQFEEYLYDYYDQDCAGKEDVNRQCDGLKEAALSVRAIQAVDLYKSCFNQPNYDSAVKLLKNFCNFSDVFSFSDDDFSFNPSCFKEGIFE